MGRSKKNLGRKGQPLPAEMLDYAKRLRRAFKKRKEADGLNQVQLQEATGLSQSVISEAMDVEHPKVGITASVIVRLCKALNVRPDYVLMGIGDEIPELAKRSAEDRTPDGVELREGQAPTAETAAPGKQPGQPATPQRKAWKRGGRRSASP